MVVMVEDLFILQVAVKIKDQYVVSAKAQVKSNGSY